ncbi:predicted protein [Fibroporia radiculosa]|uniref:Uncharacterized protein n=1 Tax=Fibroporia radiculosa TaxID=599839 RepID=J7RW76_9APHY|nr:predicted protein [Fibroporia radiculosa]
MLHTHLSDQPDIVIESRQSPEESGWI